MTEEDDGGVSLEEILIEIVDAQLEILDAVATGKPLPDSQELKGRLTDIRYLLADALGGDED